MKVKAKVPGQLSDELKAALGMVEGVPPPWLLNVQRYGPPPAYPNLKIPGLNAPIPEGASFGYHPGGWGKPPVDENGVPLYGDVFGKATESENQVGNIARLITRRCWRLTTAVRQGEEINRERWGELEEEEEGSFSWLGLVAVNFHRPDNDVELTQKKKRMKAKRSRREQKARMRAMPRLRALMLPVWKLRSWTASPALHRVLLRPVSWICARAEEPRHPTFLSSFTPFWSRKRCVFRLHSSIVCHTYTLLRHADISRYVTIRLGACLCGPWWRRVEWHAY